MNAVGKEIREFRKKYNLSQRKLCHGICTAPYLSLIENNKIEANPNTMQLLSERIKAIKATMKIPNDNILNENIGEFFLKERLEHRITQETLCYGICTVSYLSKIENNKMIASKKIQELLYKRLIEIKTNTKTEVLELLELETLYKTMISLFNKGKMDKANKILEQGLQSTKNKYSKLHYLFSYQNHLYFDQTNFKDFLKTTAIPFFKSQKDNKQLYIFYINLAECYQKENQFEKACLYYQKGISYISDSEKFKYPFIKMPNYNYGKINS